ncbi:MAG: putative lipoprotein [Sphingobacteriales bacterium]|nr:putative lipoprotein [Sphingobacteriales bacterium]
MKRLFIIPALVAALFSSCKSDKTSSVTRFNMTMTDSPGAYDAVILSIKEVHVLSSAGESTIAIGSQPFDILKFRLGKDTLLASQDLPSGRLQEIRLVLNETGNRVKVGGIYYDLTTPSSQQSGLKLKVQDDLTGGIAYTLKLDFDVAKSIVLTGNGKYSLKPVIRAIPNAVSGALTGMIMPTSSNAMIMAIAGLDTIGAIADTTGKFFFPGMPAGSYKVNVVPQSPYMPKSIESVVIVNGSVKDMGTITLTQ